MPRKRRRFTPEFKAKIAMEALRERQTLVELAQKHELQPVQISQWKKELHEKMASVFEGPIKKQPDHEGEKAKLYEEIGRLKMELDWLKKKMDALD